MRDMQEVLSRWGAWSANEGNSVDYSSIAAGFKGLIPPSSSSRIACSDDDGLLIDSVITHLKRTRKEDELELIVAHYIYGVSKRRIAKSWKVSEGRIRQQMQVAEGFIEGCLAMLNVPLEMDIEVMESPGIINSKKVLVRYAKTMLV
ncbi:antiterminator Q family protein [Proteus myxofaciens]|uniref:Phage antitermination protein Q n=1 Tax=Proteus myxofaciens ATCC 19692 TaxID=1354337 RepID=A0A198FCE8_9GAMM|nr:antiterminator Q family protein [Proteus myxofaciens]OAT22573.1 phage antitermination protein Q [Proteus myxofaciens ATCC 19692]